MLEQRVGALAEFSVLNETERPSGYEPDVQQGANQAHADIVDIAELRRRAHLQRTSLYHAMVQVPQGSLDLLRDAGIEAAPQYTPQLTLYKPVPANGTADERTLPPERARELLKDWPCLVGSWAKAMPWEKVSDFHRKRTPYLLKPQKDYEHG